MVNPPPAPAPDLRIDKWLWAVRVYKTRSQATEACRAGHVKIGGQNVKPARSVKLGEIITAQVHDLQRTVKVIGFHEQRVSAKAALAFMEDLTPPEEYAKPRESAQQPMLLRPKGAGRPTKRERRVMDAFLGE